MIDRLGKLKMMKTRLLLVSAAVTFAGPALAQSTSLDGRVGKLEKEVRAVQRVVFPQGQPIQPDLAATPVTSAPSGNTATAPIADLTARVDALERQISALTGTSEQNGYRLKQMEAAVTALQGRVAVVEGGRPTADASPAGDTTAPRTSDAIPARPAATPRSASAATVSDSATARPAARTTTRPDPARQAAIAAVEMPSTGDPIEDDYTFGFRLYTAKLFPEAEAKLKEFAAKYPPANRRWSYAQNLLGRAYYDEGKPALASVAFYDNYQKAPQGERAAESLNWLGQALVKLKKPTDACKVYRVLTEDYADKLTREQRARAAKGRADAKCPA